jgi:hypothetical protein
MAPSTRWREVGQQFSITRERIRQIKAKARGAEAFEVGKGSCGASRITSWPRVSDSARNLIWTRTQGSDILVHEDDMTMSRRLFFAAVTFVFTLAIFAATVAEAAPVRDP